jgi:hypothetical protein
MVSAPQLFALRDGQLRAWVRLRPVLRGQDAIDGISAMAALTKRQVPRNEP